MKNLVWASVTLVVRIYTILISNTLSAYCITGTLSAVWDGIITKTTLLSRVDEIGHSAGRAIILWKSGIYRAGNTVCDIFWASVTHSIILNIIARVDASNTLKLTSTIITEINYRTGSTACSICKYIEGDCTARTVGLIEAGLTVRHDWAADKTFASRVHLVSWLAAQAWENRYISICSASITALFVSWTLLRLIIRLHKVMIVHQALAEGAARTSLAARHLSWA